MLNSAENKNKIIKIFPLLINDKVFKIEDNSPNYNCIAWAAVVTDCWWDKLPMDKRPSYRHIDGVKFDWPFNVPDEFSTRVLIEIFENIKFVICATGDYEEGFKKVVIYELNGEATHMARQITWGEDRGAWTSKLGASFRISHESPKSLEGNIYGYAVLYMKKSMK